MEQVVAKLQEWTALYGLKVVASIVILVLGRFAAPGVRSLVRRLLAKSKVDQTLATFVTSVACVAVMAFVIIAALGQLGVQTASFVAVLGAAGLAVGLALQGSLANFATQEKIKKRFDAEGISIPFPQRDVHMVPAG